MPRGRDRHFGALQLGVHFRLASLADVIRSKEAAGRPKDQIALPILRELLKRQRDKSKSP